MENEKIIDFSNLIISNNLLFELIDGLYITTHET
jgi:hypothetical protein